MSNIIRFRRFARLTRKPRKTRGRLARPHDVRAPVMSSHHFNQRGEAIAHFGLTIVNVQRNCSDKCVRRFVAGAPDSGAAISLLDKINSRHGSIHLAPVR
jgi:hypothetical protein